MGKLENSVRKATLCMTRQCWEQGMLSFAFLETGQTEEQDLLTYDMVVRQSGDGRLCNVENTPAVTDSSFCIPAVLDSGKRLCRQDYTDAALRNIDYLLHDAPRAEDGTLCHMLGTTQIWADSAAFLPYSLILTGHPDEAMVQMKGILSCLYLPETGLYAHIWENAEGGGSFIDGTAWGVGNGWILTGLLRSSLAIREADPAAADWMEEKFRDLLSVMLEYMTPENSFHYTLDKEETFLDTEVCAMVVCAIYDAVRTGILQKGYKTYADRIRGYILTKVTEDGLVTDSSGSPDFAHAGTSVESQAHVLMMEAKRRALADALKQEQ